MNQSKQQVQQLLLCFKIPSTNKLFFALATFDLVT